MSNSVSTTTDISSHKIRPEIQFLRALAVTLVLLSHSQISVFGGGFVGVDIFFVISGFVIGLSLIAERSRTGKVSLTKFYQRRFFRIFPPLSLMISATTLYAFLILSFNSSQDFFIDQARAALFSFSNFYFMFNKMDYFLQDPNTVFFLHTWSLGIEEQFYIALPLLILILARLHRSSEPADGLRQWRNCFVALSVISFTTAVLLYNDVLRFWTPEFRQLFVFYSPATRSWEFILGLLVALHVSRRSAEIATARQKNLNLAYFVIASSAIAISVFGYRYGYPSQFVSSSLSAAATGLLIVSLQFSGLAEKRFFSLSVFQLVGNASYSIYLWHWIAVAVAGDVLHPPTTIQVFGLVVASLIPAFISYKVVETPFRKLRYARLRTKSLSAAALVLVPALMLWMLQVTAIRERQNYGNVNVATLLDGCDFLNEICTVGSKDASQKILLFGDSHSQQLIQIFKEYAEENNVSLVTCVMICSDKNYKRIKDNTFPSGNFSLIVNSIKTNSGQSREYRQDFTTTFDTFSRLRGAKRLVVLDNPFFADFVAPRRIKHPVLTPMPRAAQDERRRQVNIDFRADATDNVVFYDPFEVLCDSEICFVKHDGKVLYISTNHLSMVGLGLIEPSLVSTVDDMLNS